MMNEQLNSWLNTCHELGERIAQDIDAHIIESIFPRCENMNWPMVASGYHINSRQMELWPDIDVHVVESNFSTFLREPKIISHFIPIVECENEMQSIAESGSIFFIDTKSNGERYPHRCPRCNAPAYIGLNAVDCIEGCS